jgi:iron(III) transport system permease protein
VVRLERGGGVRAELASGGARLAPWLLLATVGYLVLYPVSWLVRGSLWSGRPTAAGTLTFDHFGRTLGNGEVWTLLLNSLLISGAKTVLACGLGFLLAWLVARTDLPGRRWLELLIPLPFFVPGLLVALGWVILANPTNGLLNVVLATAFGQERGPLNVYTGPGLVLVMALHSAPFVYLLTLGAMRNLDGGLEDSARVCGASGLRCGLTISLPLLLPALSGAALLTFIQGLESFEVPAILGTPGKVFVFTNEIYYRLRWTTPPDYGAAMVLALLLTAIVLVLVAAQWRLLGQRSFTTVSGRDYRPRPLGLGRWRRPAQVLIGLYLLLALVLPVGLIVASSFCSVFGLFSGPTLTLENYPRLWREPRFGGALLNTLLLTVGGGLLTMVLGGLVAYVQLRTRFRPRRLLELVSWLPWALPGLVLSLALLWSYVRFPLPIYGTVWVLLLAYVTYGLPIGVRVMSGVIVQIHPELEESARLSGASWGRSFVDVVLALARPGLIGGWFVVGFLFMRQLSIAVMLYGPGSEVLSMFSLTAWESGQGGLAAAVATVMLLLMVGLLLLELALRAWPRAIGGRGGAAEVRPAAAEAALVAS